MLRSRYIAAAGLLAACIAGLFVQGAAKADSLAPLTQKVHLDVGLFLLDTDTTVRVDGVGGGLGSEIDFKRDFGFQDQDRFRLDGYWRFFERHKLRLMYFDSNSSAERTIAKEIHFGDAVFPVSASVNARVELQILEAAYEYAFLRSDSFELAGSVGLHNLRISTNLSATASILTNGIDRNASAKGNGPLPVVGMRFTWALSDKFYFDGLAQFFGIKMDEYDGHLADYKLDFVWQPFKHFGMGIGYNHFSSGLDVSADRFTGGLDFKYGGPLLFFTTAF